MAYSRLNKKDGDVLTASDVTHIEDGIVQNESDISDVNQSLTDLKGIEIITKETVDSNTTHEYDLSAYSGGLLFILFNAANSYYQSCRLMSLSSNTASRGVFSSLETLAELDSGEYSGTKLGEITYDADTQKVSVSINVYGGTLSILGVLI